MRKSTPAQWGIRAVAYIIGLFILALGVAVSANSGLGISPVNSLPYVVSDIIHMDPGTCVTVVFCFYILLQVLILRKDFKPVQLLQIVFSTVFGYFVNFTKLLIGDWALPGYPGQLVMLAISILLIAVGVGIYIETDLVPMPMEGLSLALAGKLKKPFPTMKVIIDCTVVVVGLVLSLLFLGGFQPFLDGTARIREGTVISAFAVGLVMGFIKPLLAGFLQPLCFGAASKEKEAS